MSKCRACGKEVDRIEPKHVVEIGAYDADELLPFASYVNRDGIERKGSNVSPRNKDDWFMKHECPKGAKDLKINGEA